MFFRATLVWLFGFSIFQCVFLNIFTLHLSFRTKHWICWKHYSFWKLIWMYWPKRASVWPWMSWGNRVTMMKWFRWAKHWSKVGKNVCRQIANHHRHHRRRRRITTAVAAAVAAKTKSLTLIHIRMSIRIMVIRRAAQVIAKIVAPTTAAMAMATKAMSHHRHHQAVQRPMQFV